LARELTQTACTAFLAPRFLVSCSVRPATASHKVLAGVLSGFVGDFHNRATDVTQEHQEDYHNQKHAFSQVMQDCVRGVVNQVVAVSVGNFVKPSLDTVTEAAAAAARDMPADFRVSITNAAGMNAYPISTFTWMLIPSQFPDAAKAQAMKGFLEWMLTYGQKDTATLTYAPLPKEVVAKVLNQIAMVK
jgi:hypothetical protein